MKKILGLIIRITFGFLLCAFGTVMALNSNLGLSPWDVFHQGLTNVTHLTMGQASIIVGIIIVVITRVLGLKVGLGTIANMIVIGCFIDLIMHLEIVPVCNNVFTGIVMMIGSLFASALGSYLYIGCEMGCGPRDGLMIVLVKRTGRPVSLIRFFIEMGALIIGFLLGGFAGVGTFVTAFGIGYCVQLVYKIFRYDIKKLKHRNIKEGIRFFNECFSN